MTPRDIAEFYANLREDEYNPRHLAKAYLDLQKRHEALLNAANRFIGPENVGKSIDLKLDWSGSDVSIVTSGRILSEFVQLLKQLDSEQR